MRSRRAIYTQIEEKNWRGPGSKSSRIAAMADMSEATKIRQALGPNLAAAKIALVFVVMWAGMYLWKRTALHLSMLCLWSAVSIVSLLVYRARKRKLHALDPD